MTPPSLPLAMTPAVHSFPGFPAFPAFEAYEGLSAAHAAWSGAAQG